MSLPLRPLLAGIVIVGILGGMALYTNFLERLKAQAQAEARAREAIIETKAGGEYAIRVTLTFDAAPNTFNIEQADAPTLLVTKDGANGKVLLRVTEPIPAETPRDFPIPDELVTGENRLTMRVFPADPTKQAMAGRFSVLRNGDELGETVQPFWAENGTGQAVINFKLSKATVAPSH